MSLCRLMVMDFTDNIGRYEGRCQRYSDRDLEFSIIYAEDLIEHAYTQEPFYKYCLKGFIKWAKLRLHS